MSTNQWQRSPHGMFLWMRRHPYLLTILLCGVLLPFGYADRANLKPSSYVYLGVVLGAGAAAAIFTFRIGRALTERLLLCSIAAAGVTAAMMIVDDAENKTTAIALIAVLAAAAGALFIRRFFTPDARSVIMLLILLGIVIRFVYVLYTGSGDRQHDVGFFNWKWGHANYIEYWYKNGMTLPDFDVTSIWQYYHPPFHHWLMALLLQALTELDVAYPTACEALQILPMLYSCLTMIVCYRIFRLAGLKDNPLIAAMALICFHPTFILFGGAFNNDMLVTLLMMAAIMWGIRWYREPILQNIIPTALCIGLGMMTKLSGWMVAPGVAFLFVVVLIKHIKKPLKLLGQYLLFGVICVPLGLWWQVRNLLLFKVPITYVPMLSVNDPIYGGNLSVSERLLNFGGQQFTYVYDAYTAYGAPYDERNPTLGLFKTAMFDEGTNSITAAHFPQIKVTAPILYWISVVLFLLCFACLIRMLCRKSDRLNGAERVYFALLTAVILGSYYWFCLKYPFTCTYNIRYCMPLIPLCAMGLGLFLQNAGNSRRAKGSKRFLYALCGAFCMMSYLVYTQIGAALPIGTS